MEPTSTGIATGGAVGLLIFAAMVLISGLIVGGLARLVLPGPDPMSWGKTFLYGLGGSLLGGLVFQLIRFLVPMPEALSLIFSVAGAAFLIWALRRRPRTSAPSPRSAPRHGP